MSRVLQSAHVGVKVRLAIMWAVIMFFYIYNDIFMLLKAARNGEGLSTSPLDELALLVYALIITPPALMPLLCLVLKPALNRWVNIIVGTAYFSIIVWTVMPLNTSWFYRYIGVVENLVTLATIWTAWRWPRDERASEVS